MCMWGWEWRSKPALCPTLIPTGVSSPPAHCLRGLWAGGNQEETSERVQEFPEEVRNVLRGFFFPASRCLTLFRLWNITSVWNKSMSRCVRFFYSWTQKNWNICFWPLTRKIKKSGLTLNLESTNRDRNLWVIVQLTWRKSQIQPITTLKYREN